jgi:molybdopterin molybdotransferase
MSQDPNRARSHQAHHGDAPGRPPDEHGALASMLSIDEAAQAIEARLPRVRGASCEEIPLPEALGRVLGRDMISPIDVPAHDNAAMDGYAFDAGAAGASPPHRLRVVGTAWAGSPWPGRVGAHETVRVMTGAVMPAGTDTVVPQEHVRRERDTITFGEVPPIGENRRLRGEDLARGRVMLAAGRRLRAADLGLLASVGRGTAPVLPRLRVAILSTGTELRSIGETLGPGEIFDSNRFTLRAMLERLGVEIIDLGVARDEPDALEAVLREAASRADAVISSGGVSVGEADFTRAVMARLGEVSFRMVAMRPGRPLAFGRLGDAAYFGLPGNPVAVMITFLFLVRPGLLRMMGAREPAALALRARSRELMRKKPGRTEYQRAIVEADATGELWVRSTGSQGSGVLRSMSEANAIAVLEHERGAVAIGDPVSCVLLDALT